MKIILASASPRRRELMKYITENFTAVSIDCDETIPSGINPPEVSEYLANLKALAANRLYPDDIVIGCDTTVICENNILTKPSTKENCIAGIGYLSDRTHKVVTGCSIICGDNKVSFSEITDVTFRKLSDEEIEQYASTDEPYDKAGGYAIQGKGSDFILNISGDYFNVVGLPVTRLYQELKKFTRIIKENQL